MTIPAADDDARASGTRGRTRRWSRSVFWFVAIGALIAALFVGFTLQFDPLVRAATRPWCPSGTEHVSAAHEQTPGFHGWHYELACLSGDGERAPVSAALPMATMFVVGFAVYAAGVLLIVLLAPPILRRVLRRPPDGGGTSAT